MTFTERLCYKRRSLLLNTLPEPDVVECAFFFFPYSRTGNLKPFQAISYPSPISLEVLSLCQTPHLPFIFIEIEWEEGVNNSERAQC